MLNQRVQMLRDEMEMMKDRIMQLFRLKADEIYAVIDKKADDVRILRLSINELNQIVTETKLEFEKTSKSVRSGQNEV